MGPCQTPHPKSIKHMKIFKEGDTLTLTDVIESFRKINGTGMPNDNVDLSNRPMDKDGAIIFDS